MLEKKFLCLDGDKMCYKKLHENKYGKLEVLVESNKHVCDSELLDKGLNVPFKCSYGDDILCNNVCLDSILCLLDKVHVKDEISGMIFSCKFAGFNNLLSELARSGIHFFTRTRCKIYWLVQGCYKGELSTRCIKLFKVMRLSGIQLSLNTLVAGNHPYTEFEDNYQGLYLPCYVIKKFFYAFIALPGQKKIYEKTTYGCQFSSGGINNQKEGSKVLEEITRESCWGIMQKFVIFILEDKDDLKKGKLSIIYRGIGTTVIVLMINLVMRESSEVKEFMEALQAGNDFNVIGLMDVGLYFSLLVASKVILCTRLGDEEHCMWKSTTSHLVTAIRNINGVQFDSKSCDVMQNDAIIRVAGQIIPTVKRVIYASHLSTRDSLVEPVCGVMILTLKLNALRRNGCVRNQMLQQIVEEMQRPDQIMGCRGLDSDFRNTENSSSLNLNAPNAMVSQLVSIADFLIVDMNVKDLLSFDWEKAKQVIKNCPTSTKHRIAGQSGKNYRIYKQVVLVQLVTAYAKANHDFVERFARIFLDQIPEGNAATSTLTIVRYALPCCLGNVMQLFEGKREVYLGGKERLETEISIQSLHMLCQVLRIMIILVEVFMCSLRYRTLEDLNNLPVCNAITCTLMISVYAYNHLLLLYIRSKKKKRDDRLVVDFNMLFSTHHLLLNVKGQSIDKTIKYQLVETLKAEKFDLINPTSNQFKHYISVGLKFEAETIANETEDVEQVLIKSDKTMMKTEQEDCNYKSGTYAKTSNCCKRVTNWITYDITMGVSLAKQSRVKGQVLKLNCILNDAVCWQKLKYKLTRQTKKLKVFYINVMENSQKVYSILEDKDVLKRKRMSRMGQMLGGLSCYWG